MKMKYFEEPKATVVALDSDIVRTSEPGGDIPGDEPSPSKEQYELPMIK